MLPNLEYTPRFDKDLEKFNKKYNNLLAYIRGCLIVNSTQITTPEEADSITNTFSDSFRIEYLEAFNGNFIPLVSKIQMATDLFLDWEVVEYTDTTTIRVLILKNIIGG